MQSRFLVVLLLSTLALEVQADGVSYDHVQVRYADIETNALTYTIHGNQLILDASWSVTDSMYLALDYEKLGANEQGEDLDQKTLHATFGYHLPLSDDVDFFAEAGIVDSSVDFIYRDDLASGQFSDSDTGYIASIGIRRNLDDKGEFYMNVNYLSLYDDTDVSYQLGTLIRFSTHFSALIGYRRDNVAKQFEFGLRYDY